jgi:hypothetical protein
LRLGVRKRFFKLFTLWRAPFIIFLRWGKVSKRKEELIYVEKKMK